MRPGKLVSLIEALLKQKLLKYEGQVWCFILQGGKIIFAFSKV